MDVLITQIRPAFFSADCGMCYVLRLADGRFVLIDGNIGEYEEPDRLWDVMNAQNARDGKPVVAAWIFTHAHCDHIGGFTAFMQKYGDGIILENLFFRFPGENDAAPSGNEPLIREFEKIADKQHVVTPRAGDRYTFGGALIDILYSCADAADYIENFNDTSLVFMITLAGKRILFTGDILRRGAERLCEMYPPERLKCDILQVAHHGYYGANEALYRAADPDILLWSCPDFWYPVVRHWGASEYLTAAYEKDKIFISGRAQTTLDLNKPYPAFSPYPQYKAGEVICEETFDGGRVIDLGWSCLTGGHTGYKAAEAEIKDGACTLKNPTDAFTVCQIVQPGVLRKNPDFNFSFTAEIAGETDPFGLFWDYDEPTVFREEKILRLPLSPGKSAVFTLRADSEKQRAALYKDGALLREMPCRTAGGLYFVFRRAALTLRHIRVIKQ